MVGATDVPFAVVNAFVDFAGPANATTISEPPRVVVRETVEAGVVCSPTVGDSDLVMDELGSGVMVEVETTDDPGRVVIGNGDVVIDQLGSEVMVATDVSFLVVDNPVSVVETR